MSAHTHDIDWVERISALRRADELHAPVHEEIAAHLMDRLGPQPVVVDVGSGAGGMSVAFATALARRGGGTLVLVDAVPELLDVAQTVAGTALARTHADAVAAPPQTTDAVGAQPSSPEEPVELEQALAEIDGASVAATVGRGHPGPGAVSAAASAPQVVIDVVRADVASVSLDQLVPAADLVWAASMVHHLPDQQTGIAGFVTGLKPGGMLALAEGRPPTCCLPWDLGIGEPGLERRLLAALDRWFGQMRAGMPGSIRMPYGWNVALGKAGLERTGSFSRLIDFPAPLDAAVRNYVVEHLAWLSSVGDEFLTQEDRDVLRTLLDPADSAYLGHREDIYVLGAQTVHFGFRR